MVDIWVELNSTIISSIVDFQSQLIVDLPKFLRLPFQGEIIKNSNNLLKITPWDGNGRYLGRAKFNDNQLNRGLPVS